MALKMRTHIYIRQHHLEAGITTEAMARRRAILADWLQMTRNLGLAWIVESTEIPGAERRKVTQYQGP